VAACGEDETRSGIVSQHVHAVPGRKRRRHASATGVQGSHRSVATTQKKARVRHVDREADGSRAGRHRPSADDAEDPGVEDSDLVAILKIALHPTAPHPHPHSPPPTPPTPPPPP